MLMTVELACVMLPEAGERLLLSVVPLYVEQIKTLWAKRVKQRNDLLIERLEHPLGREKFPSTLFLSVIMGIKFSYLLLPESLTFF